MMIILFYLYPELFTDQSGSPLRIPRKEAYLKSNYRKEYLYEKKIVSIVFNFVFHRNCFYLL